jgi:hypothetical protein
VLTSVAPWSSEQLSSAKILCLPSLLIVLYTVHDFWKFGHIGLIKGFRANEEENSRERVTLPQAHFDSHEDVSRPLISTLAYPKRVKGLRKICLIVCDDNINSIKILPDFM